MGDGTACARTRGYWRHRHRSGMGIRESARCPSACCSASWMLLLTMLLTPMPLPADGNPRAHPGAHDLLHVVVTWSAGGNTSPEDTAQGAPRNISNLVSLRHGARIILYAKGFNCTELRRFPEVERRVAACHSTPNYGGREAHTMLHHAAHYYKDLAHFTMFLHDDDTAPDSRGDQTSWIGLVNEWIDDRARQNATLLEPHTHEGCVCDVVHEDFFTPERYGYWSAMQHLMRTFLNTTHEGPDIVWPASARFMVARPRIVKHSQELYRRILDSGILLNLDHFANDHENCAAPVEEIADLRAVGNGNACPHSLGWAHTFERMWFLLW